MKSDASSESKYTMSEYGKSGVDQSPVLGEADPASLPIGISIHKLRKDYKKGKKHCIAVNDLTVNFYKNQITAFLGENGAGKTTTINMLTGYTRPTSGRAFIEGRDILKDVTKIRQDIGICPQGNVLFEYMTVTEHLDFYVHLKGKGTRRQKKEERDNMLRISGLIDHRKTIVCKLSGGQKRRLSVVLAFIGGSRVIILDEPTSGVDPCARRAIWDLIIQNRQDRTILLCTHHLDEADILADRVVMLHEGSMVCAGSPMFLKLHYGSGYQLTLSKDQDHKDTSSIGNNVLRFVQQHISDAYMSEDIGSEITIVLPTDKGQMTRFQQLFVHLDTNLHELQVTSYGISATSLEEVFLKFINFSDRSDSDNKVPALVWMGSSHPDKAVRESGWSSSSTASTSQSQQSTLNAGAKSIFISGTTTNSFSTLKRIKGSRLNSYQFGALFMKRLHHHRRDLKSYFSQIILPVAFMCLAMGVALIKPQPTNSPSILLTPAMYGPHTDMFFRMDSSTEWNKKYLNTMLRQPGIATTCMTDSDMIGNCTKPLDATFRTPSVSDASIYRDPEPCVCSDGYEVCPAGAGGFPTPRHTTQADNYLHNLTGHQFTTHEYLIRTHNEYLNNRFGGWGFGVNSNGEEETSLWFNNKGWHALPSYYSSLSNMVLRANMPTDQAKYGISTYNHPLPLDRRQLTEEFIMQGIAETGIALTILCAFCFVPAGYAIYLIQERITKEKRLQLVSGVGLGLYWFTAFIWDMLAYLFTVGLAVAVAAAFHIPTYTHRLNLAALAVTLIMFGWACIPMVYLVVRIFKNPAIGYMTMFLTNLIIGIITTSCVFLVNLFDYKENLVEASAIMEKVFLIFPQFCMGDALIRLSRNQFLYEINAMFHQDTYVNPFSFDMMAWHFVAMTIQGFVFLILHMILESQPCQKSRKMQKNHVMNRHKMDPDYKEDEDVSLERQRVMTGEARNDLLVLYNLKKEFKKGRKNITAVDNLTLGIPRGECFGLLGVNGAGKTTTFNMMTGEVVPTAGAALLEANIISENVPDMDGRVGYCPQDDALDQNLTVTEVLIFYSKLKGLHSSGIKDVVNLVMNMLGLNKYKNKTVKSLSGGTKRKLSTAVSLLGDPDLILMDEPTSGMDPKTKRLVWNMIIQLIKDNRSVILTSHSMEECEAICTRLAIMVNGRFMCLGSQQHIQHRYGRGYTLTIKASNAAPDLSRIVDYVTRTFNGAILKNQHLNMLEFEISHSVAKLADIFGSLESSRGSLGIQDYAVSQTSLDQVFIGFARYQHDGVMKDTPGPDPSIGPPGYNNPGYDTWEERPAANVYPELKSQNGAPHHTGQNNGLERAAVAGNMPVYDGDYNMPVGKPVARPTTVQPVMTSVITVGNPRNIGNMKPEEIADPAIVSVRL